MGKYFANLEQDDLVKELAVRVKRFNRYTESTGLHSLWKKSAQFYYGNHSGEGANDGAIRHVGESGEVKAVQVNHYRNLVKHVLALTTSQKVDYDARAVNTDLQSLMQTKLASNILDSYVDEKRMGRHMCSAAERALVFSKGFVYIVWDPSLGEPEIGRAHV